MLRGPPNPPKWSGTESRPPIRCGVGSGGVDFNTPPSLPPCGVRPGGWESPSFRPWGLVRSTPCWEVLVGSNPWSFQSGVSWWSWSFSSALNHTFLWEKILFQVSGMSVWVFWQTLEISFRDYTIKRNRVRPYDLKGANNLLYTLLYAIHYIL